jgi:hypothetical protein
MVAQSPIRRLVSVLSLAGMLALLSGLAYADDPIREVTDRTGDGDLVKTSTVNLKYVRTSDGKTVCVAYLLLEPPDPVATMLLFVGGDGTLGIGDGGVGVRLTNFNFRNRLHFAAAGPFNVAVIDAPYEGLGDVNDTCSSSTANLRPLDPVFRLSDPHLEDVETVIADLRQFLPNSLRLIVNGTSRGAISAGAAAAYITGDNKPDGLVLTASQTRPSNAGNASLLDVPLESIHLPSVLAAHKRDGCSVTPPEDLKVIQKRLKAGHSRVKSKLFAGGLTPLSDECGSLAAHGFFGIEPDVVQFIARSIH